MEHFNRVPADLQCILIVSEKIRERESQDNSSDNGSTSKVLHRYPRDHHVKDLGKRTLQVP